MKYEETFRHRTVMADFEIPHFVLITRRKNVTVYLKQSFTLGYYDRNT